MLQRQAPSVTRINEIQAVGVVKEKQVYRERAAYVEERLKQLARQVRRWAMRNRAKYHSTCRLDGMCAITSARLFIQLRNAGFHDTKLCVTKEDDHAFILCSGYVVDVTATQFDSHYKAVVVIPIEEEATDDLWEVGKAFQNMNAIREHFSEWPLEQQPHVVPLSPAR